MTNEEHLSKALNLLIEWVTDCNFGYDNIPEEYEKYADVIEKKGMGYSEGLRYILLEETKV